MGPGHVEPALRVIRNSGLLMAGEMYGVSVNLVTVAILSRYLPLDVFGDYGFILAVSMTFMVLTDMGAAHRDPRDRSRPAQCRKGVRRHGHFALSVLRRDVRRDHGDGSDDFRFAAVLRATSISAIAVVVFFLGDVPPIVFIAYERMQFNAIVKVAAETVYLAGIVAVAFFDFGLNGVFLVSLASYAARLAIGLLILKRCFFSPRLTWDPALLRWLFLEALPVGANRASPQGQLPGRYDPSPVPEDPGGSRNFPRDLPSGPRGALRPADHHRRALPSLLALLRGIFRRDGGLLREVDEVPADPRVPADARRLRRCGRHRRAPPRQELRVHGGALAALRLVWGVRSSACSSTRC